MSSSCSCVNLIPQDEMARCYKRPEIETVRGKWIHMRELAAHPVDVVKLIVRGIITRHTESKRRGDYCPPHMRLLYELRVQLLIRFFLPNDEHYSYMRTIDLSAHPGRTAAKSKECEATIYGYDTCLILLQQNRREEVMDLFTETDEKFWKLRYDRWQATRA